MSQANQDQPIQRSMSQTKPTWPKLLFMGKSVEQMFKAIGVKPVGDFDIVVDRKARSVLEDKRREQLGYRGYSYPGQNKRTKQEEEALLVLRDTEYIEVFQHQTIGSLEGYVDCGFIVFEMVDDPEKRKFDMEFGVPNRLGRFVKIEDQKSYGCRLGGGVQNCIHVTGWGEHNATKEQFRAWFAAIQAGEDPLMKTEAECQ